MENFQDEFRFTIRFQRNLQFVLQSGETIFSQTFVSCPLFHVISDKNNNNGKITNNIGNSSSTFDFGDKNNLSYSYKVPDQLQVDVYR